MAHTADLLTCSCCHSRGEQCRILSPSVSVSLKSRDFVFWKIDTEYELVVLRNIILPVGTVCVKEFYKGMTCFNIASCLQID